MTRIDDAGTTQALKLLMQDHRRIRRLLRHAEDSANDPAEQSRAVDLACRALVEHASLEEALLYPRLRELADAATMRAQFEHDVARQLVARLAALRPDDAEYAGTLRDLAEWIDDHVREEEDTLVGVAKDANLDLAPLAGALLERQREGAPTDVDVDAEVAGDTTAGATRENADRSAHDRRRERSPRRGAH